MASHKHVNDGNRYARDVVSGKKPGCVWTRLACQRHLDDLKRKEWRYKFNKQAADDACHFIEALPHVKGRWAQQRKHISLSDWQKFALINIFGWVDKDTGLRRYRTAFILVPRKNGKSVLAAGIGLIMLCADKEFGAEIYSGATSEKQAWEVFRPARLMAARTPDLQHQFGLSVHAASLAIVEDGSRFEPLIGRPGDGSSPSCAIVDEYHEHDKPDLYDTMLTGMGAREHPLMLVISTAGSNISGPCYEMQTDVQKILDGTFEDDRTFGLIYSIDEDDDWKTECSLRKANPNYDISVSGDYLHSQVQAAIRSPSKQNIVKTKHFNLWTGARAAWLNMEMWHKCGDNKLTIEDCAQMDSVIAIDLASKIDIAAIAHIFYRYDEAGLLHYYCFPTLYLPEAALETAKNAQRYLGWHAEGNLELIDGDEVDFAQIQEHVLELRNQYQINEVIYDPWQATQLAQNLEKAGAKTVEFRNTVQNMSPAMKEMEGAIHSGRFHHANHPVLTWMASNVTAKADAKDNIFPRKEADDPHKKIDGMVAAIMGVGRAFFAQPQRSAYEDQGLLIL